jgi:hypothetical protein
MFMVIGLVYGFSSVFYSVCNSTCNIFAVDECALINFNIQGDYYIPTLVLIQSEDVDVYKNA